MPSTHHGTLTADQVTTFQLDAGRNGIVVVNRAQEGIIWARIDGTNPVPEADDTYAVFGAREFPLLRRSVPTVTIKLLSDADRAFTVEAY